MKPSITLTIYGVRVKPAHTRKTYERLDSFSDQDADLYDVLREFLERHEREVYRAADSQQAAQVSKTQSRKRQIEGVLNAGQYGTQSEIRNLNRWEKIAYNKGTLDVDLRPFYFLFDLPEGRDLGFFLSQSTGLEGVHTLVSKMLHDLFASKFPDYRLHMNHIIPEELIKQLSGKEAQLSEVRFVRHRIPRDITTVIGPAGTEQSAGTMDLVVKLKEDNVGVQAVRRFFDRRRGTENVLELEGTRFPYDNVKIKVKLHGKERMVDLGDPNRIRPRLDVTEKVTFSSAGHPTFASISEAAKDVLADVKTALYGNGNVPG